MKMIVTTENAEATNEVFAACKKVGIEVVELTEVAPNYRVQPCLYMKRGISYARQKAVASKWKWLKKPVSHHSNINMYLRYDLADELFYFKAELREESPRVNDLLCNVISSALMMYRCGAMGFAPHFNNTDSYKTLCSVSLKHKETGEHLVIQDYKAGIDLSTVFHNTEDMPVSYREDVLELLNFLVSGDVLHPYDLTVAGSVA